MSTKHEVKASKNFEQKIPMNRKHVVRTQFHLPSIDPKDHTKHSKLDTMKVTASYDKNDCISMLEIRNVSDVRTQDHPFSLLYKCWYDGDILKQCCFNAALRSARDPDLIARYVMQALGRDPARHAYLPNGVCRLSPTAAMRLTTLFGYPTQAQKLNYLYWESQPSRKEATNRKMIKSEVGAMEAKRQLEERILTAQREIVNMINILDEDGPALSNKCDRLAVVFRKKTVAARFIVSKELAAVELVAGKNPSLYLFHKSSLYHGVPVDLSDKDSYIEKVPRKKAIPVLKQLLGIIAKE